MKGAAKQCFLRATTWHIARSTESEASHLQLSIKLPHQDLQEPWTTITVQEGLPNAIPRPGSGRQKLHDFFQLSLPPKYRTRNLPWRRRPNWESRAPEDRDSPICSDLTRLQFPTKGLLRNKNQLRKMSSKFLDGSSTANGKQSLVGPRPLQTSWPSNQAKP